MIDGQRDLYQTGLRLVPSTAHTLPDVHDAEEAFGHAGRAGAYDEGTATHKYYPFNAFSMEAEKAAQAAVQDAVEAVAPGNRFNVNVQPLSGANANRAVWAGLMEAGDSAMALKLSDGSHLTHFSEVNESGRTYDPHYFEIQPDGSFDWDAIECQMAEVKPKVLVMGGSAIPREVDYARAREICDRHGTVLVADISHTAEHVFTGNLSNSPLMHAHVVTFTTHKTGGPKAAVILTREGLSKEGFNLNPKRLAARGATLADLINSGLFPGEQGGPKSENYPAIQVLFEALQTKVMRGHSRRVLRSIQNIQHRLEERGIVMAARSETHLLLFDVERAVDPEGKGLAQPPEWERRGGKSGKLLNPWGVHQTEAGRRLSEAAERAGLDFNANGGHGDKNGSMRPGFARVGANGPARRKGWGEAQDIWLADKIADMVDALRNNSPEELEAVVTATRSELDTLIKAHPIRWDIDYEAEDGPLPQRLAA